MEKIELVRGRGRKVVVITEPVKGRKLMVKPDQTLSIQEIMKRFTKKLPIDASERVPVYVGDNREYDYESVSRMTFDEKREFARAMQEKQRAIVDEQKRRKEELAIDAGAESEDRESAAEAPKKRSSKSKESPKAEGSEGTGIEIP